MPGQPTPPQSIVLAGGGHSHALVLRRWAMQPERRPGGLITLVNRHSTALYSGMVPGLIAGHVHHHEVAIDLRQLADQAGVALVVAEITGLDLQQRLLLLADRAALPFDLLSLDVGAISRSAEPSQQAQRSQQAAIKPLEPALAWLQAQDAPGPARDQPFQIIGAGLAGVEVAFALRQRWPQRRLQLAARAHQPHPRLQQALQEAGIERLVNPSCTEVGPGLRCTGSRAPSWLEHAGLPVDGQGRVQTDATLQVIDHVDVFASGDCAVIRSSPRPPSGVWAVRAAGPLARNLEAVCAGTRLTRWRPQRWALQLLGGTDRHAQPTAWALWGPWLLGPHPLLWHWKQRIDRRFMARFRLQSTMPTAGNRSTTAMLCRGCAAKLPSAPLAAALSAAGLASLGSAPEDAVPLAANPGLDGRHLLQSVDGFPALVSDPWLNGRLTALHASSDLWACGAAVQSAQAVITLPRTHRRMQELLLSQTLGGIRTALEDQGAALIGGHTLEARDPAPSTDSPALGVQVVLTVNSAPVARLWPKRGLQVGDDLLLSRPLGTGVLFAAAMAGAARPGDLDTALSQMARTQHPVVETLRRLEHEHPGQLHAATDITGFGLLGHLGEMLHPERADAERLQLHLDAEAIPALPGALTLLEAGHSSSLAPANRRAWALLDGTTSRPSAVVLNLGAIPAQSRRHQALLELLVDPQTCGPLLLSVKPALAEALLRESTTAWQRIGRVSHA